MAETIVERYLEVMHRQRRECFSLLEGAGEGLIWGRPEEKAWSIGENLDHLRVIGRSTLRMFRAAWVLLGPWAKWARGRPYRTEIENVYRRPGFPQNVGWIWPPKYTPSRPVDPDALYRNLEAMHGDLTAFYIEKDPDLLGHVSLWDPAIGLHNLIKWLRVGIYHEEMHYEQIAATLAKVRRAGR